MQGNKIYAILKDIGATHLHHANSVATSCTFLEQGALLSRDYVERNHLLQTPQGSDPDDKKYGIWDRIFLDHVDIHERGGRKKGPNPYGPVLFVFQLDILLNLPKGTEIEVTKDSPSHWWKILKNVERWYQSTAEIAEQLRLGNFDKLFVLKTPDGRLEFPNHHIDIILDDPRRQVSGKADAYTHAEDRLRSTAASGKVTVNIQKRTCPAECKCLEVYARMPIVSDLYFK